LADSLNAPLHLHTTVANPERDWTAIFIPDEVLGVKRRVFIEGTLNGMPIGPRRTRWVAFTYW